MGRQRSAYRLMDLQEDLPDELPSWAFEEDVLGGFEDFLDINFKSDALHGLEAEAADEMAIENVSAGPEVSRSAAVHATQELSASRPLTDPSNTGVMRRQQKNREAQQRFRERQRVGAISAVDFAIANLSSDDFIIMCHEFASAFASCKRY